MFQNMETHFIARSNAFVPYALQKSCWVLLWKLRCIKSRRLKKQCQTDPSVSPSHQGGP